MVPGKSDNLDKMVTQDQLLHFIGTLDDLPSLPESTTHLLEILKNPNKGIADAVLVIKKDPGLAAQLLKLANSVFYSARQPITTLDRAAARIGLEPIRRLTLTHGLMGAFRLKTRDYDLETFWRRSLSVAYIAEALLGLVHTTDGLPIPTASDCFTAGLIHDLGVLAFIRGFPNAAVSLIRAAQEKQVPMYLEERNTLGIGHLEIGEALCRKWKMPESLAAVARYHHEPELAEDSCLHLVQLVHVADFICINRAIADGGEANPAQISHGAWEGLGLQLEDIPRAIDLAEEAAKRAELLL